jgi:circadian clock protein KaiB
MRNDVTQLTLYIAGNSRHSQAAIANFRWICDVALHGHCSYQIVDLLVEPELAARERVMATPTLVRTGAGKPRRIVGDLSDATKVLRSLGLNAPW